MLKTNTKKAKENTRAFLRNAIEYPAEIVENYNNNARLDCSSAAPDFGEWLVNYECALDVYFDEQRARLAAILEETPEEAARFDGSRVHDLYKYLTAREFLPAFGYVEKIARNRAGKIIKILVKMEG